MAETSCDKCHTHRSQSVHQWTSKETVARIQQFWSLLALDLRPILVPSGLTPLRVEWWRKACVSVRLGYGEPSEAIRRFVHAIYSEISRQPQSSETHVLSSDVLLHENGTSPFPQRFGIWRVRGSFDSSKAFFFSSLPPVSPFLGSIGAVCQRIKLDLL